MFKVEDGKIRLRFHHLPSGAAADSLAETGSLHRYSVNVQIKQKVTKAVIETLKDVKGSQGCLKAHRCQVFWSCLNGKNCFAKALL